MEADGSCEWITWGNSSVLNTLHARFIRFRPFCFRVSNVVHTFNVPYVSPFLTVAGVSCEDAKGIQRTINGW